MSAFSGTSVARKLIDTANSPAVSRSNHQTVRTFAEWLDPCEREIPMMAARPVRLLLVLLLITITLVLIVKPGTSSARAATASGTAARVPRVPTLTPGNVTYHGGSVMTGTMNVYVIFWEPQGWAVDPNYNSLITQYYNDVGGSSLYKVMNQYTQESGGAPTSAILAGSWVDPDPYPGSGNPREAPTQQQIVMEIQTAMQINGWQAGPSNYFAVYTAEGVVDNNECGYHSVVPSNTILFGYIPYPAGNCLGLLPTSPNTCLACDIAISASAHEQFEAATDPFYYTSPGWYYQTTTGEIADLCTYPYASTTQLGALLYDNGNANQSWNGHFYLIQEMWDNSVIGGKGGCSQGSQIFEYPIPTSGSFPFDITAGPDGNLWFTEANPAAGKIGRITPTGTITEYPTPTSDSSPEGITAGPDGNLWFTELGASQIGRITPTGAITEYQIPTSDSGPLGITAGPDGNLWFTENYGSKIGRITPGGAITEYPLVTGDGAPEGITTGPDGNLWFTENNVAGQIGRITPGGAITEYPIPTADSGPRRIILGLDGNLWFTENSANRIGRITPTGAITEYSVPTSSSGPFGIAAGPDGNLWFTEQGGNNIGKITP
jgi:streptogramin lyase